MKMQVISSLAELEKKRSDLKQTQTVGFVPTMGFLHKGHLSLVRKAREENDIVVVSIFVNPAQFGPTEDLSSYPSDLAKDLQLLDELSVDMVFTPSAKDMYPEGFTTFVEPTGIVAQEVEGASRPGHFRGMATVVLKLFNIVKPDNAYFGQKDAQQAIIVSNMIKDLNLPIQLTVMPIIREKDGLAMSSRNTYLSKAERTAAGILYKSLQKGEKIFDKNSNNNVDNVLEVIKETVATEPLVKLEYAEIRHPESFSSIKTVQRPALILVAAKVGKTRLIDNFLLV